MLTPRARPHARWGVPWYLAQPSITRAVRATPARRSAALVAAAAGDGVTEYSPTCVAGEDAARLISRTGTSP